jgi:hypothetical protein
MTAQVLGMKTKLCSSMLVIAGLLAIAPGGRGASPSELLEEGIYAEETKGDLDAALKLYGQAVAGAQAERAAAAQAQFRIGACQYKKRDSAAAMAAFAQVVKDYPEQKELVAAAADYLYRAMPLLPAPWVEGEQLRLDLRSNGAKSGSWHFWLTAGETNGTKVWRVMNHCFWGPFGQSLSRAEVEAATFRPLRSLWKSSWGGAFETVYHAGYVDVTRVGTSEARRIDLPGAVYDNETCIQMIRRLPLATNYSVQFYSAGLNGMTGERMPALLGYQVAGLENLQVPAGTYSAYNVRLNLGESNWYSSDPRRYLLKIKQRDWVFELAATTRREPGQPLAYRDASGFSLTLPPGWLADPYEKEDFRAALDRFKLSGLLSQLGVEAAINGGLAFLDPEAAGICGLLLCNREALSPSARQSPRAWAEQELAVAAKVADLIPAGDSPKDLRLRSNSWQDLEVGGNPAVSVVGDFLLLRRQTTACGVWTFDGPNALRFVIVAGKNDFEALRPKFDAIVQSYKR